ncbi:hypothetical protein HELRODRAFT_163169 [Helobdella robusta]|uniref:TGS domain-containing protein n=1 Tax=Helobdella robusta TaxID=6412 RepID=T1ETR2_HELRO|nr:hypothetical protein HELRODRAFT_163169 [Helobdella robusta]ESN96136.1 hypothetical protein HELRODRAFT_163169 [Helobdella robusta]
MLTRKIFSNYNSRYFCKKVLNIEKRYITNESVTKKRNELFEQEKSRQLNLIKRVEKIEVHYKGAPEDCTLIMNKDLSTPFNCAMHMKEFLMIRSVVALVNGKPWDMHRPLLEDCTLELKHFKDDDPNICNEAYWRTCSFVLGYILERAFKSDYYIELCSFPKPEFNSGSFVYDVQLNLDPESIKRLELSCFSRIGGRLHFEDNKFERIEVTLYRMKDHVDMTKGPLITNSNLIGRYSVVAVHCIDSPDYGKLSRVQGVSIPCHLPVHFWTYDILCQRAAKINTCAPIPTLKAVKKIPDGEADYDTLLYEFFSNRWVLRSALNFVSDGEIVREVGRGIQRKGPETSQKVSLALLTPIQLEHCNNNSNNS